MGKFESYPSINSLSDDDITLYNHNTVTHKINFARLAQLIKTKVSESIPIQGSTNLVTSGGIYNAIKASADSKADKATTLEGYGITDAYNMVESNIRFIPKYSIDSSGWDNAPTASSTNPVVSNGVYEAIRDATTDMVGATASADGTRGLVPKPSAGDEDKVLKGDGTWGEVTSSSSISTLTDVDLTNISDGQLLRYNGTSQKWENIGVDTTPTQNSTNPVSSGGVYTGLGEKQPTYSADSTAWDTAPTASSTNPVTSGGVKTELDKKLPTYANGSGSWDTSPTASSTKPVTSGGIKTQFDAVSNEFTDINNVLGAKNMLPNGASTVTTNGITFTVNSNGSVKATGTASADAVLVLSSSFYVGNGKKVILSGCPSGSSTSKYYIQMTNANGTTGKGNDVGSGVTITADADNLGCRIIVKKNQALGTTGITFSPMVRPANIRNASYVPYAMTNRQLTTQINDLNKLLWTNPNPGSSMGSTTITLSDNVQNYRMLRISFKIDFNGNYYTNAFVTVGDTYTQAIRVTSMNVDGTLLYYRGVGISTGKSLSIEGGFYVAGLNATPADYAGALVPVHVWGIK